MQNRIKIGYVPNSQDLKHPADRRRLAAWAIEKNVNLNVINPLDSDLLFLSNAANFGYWIKRAKQPVVLDLVDGYLGEDPPLPRDIARNVVRSIRGSSSLSWLTYSNHVRNACQKSAGVIVASKEQREIVLEFNSNVFVILDDHSELDSKTSIRKNNINHFQLLPAPHNLFWEGFGFTLKHFQPIAADLDKFLFESGWGMYLVTDEQFPKWGGYIGKVSAQRLVDKWFPLSKQSIQIVPWSVKNLIHVAEKSKLGIIPIDTRDKFAVLKPENKLLSMWHLGLPVIFSNTPSYSRLASKSNQEQACIQNGKWFAALTFFSQASNERKKLKRLGMKYVSEYHTHRILMNEWSRAIEILASYRVEK